MFVDTDHDNTITAMEVHNNCARLSQALLYFVMDIQTYQNSHVWNYLNVVAMPPDLNYSQTPDSDSSTS